MAATVWYMAPARRADAAQWPEFGLKRIMGNGTAEVLSVVTGILVILGTTCAQFRIPRDVATGRPVAQSATLVPLTVCCEFAIGMRDGQSPSALAGHSAIWRGELWPLVLVALAATPFLWRGRR